MGSEWNVSNIAMPSGQSINVSSFDDPIAADQVDKVFDPNLGTGEAVKVSDLKATDLKVESVASKVKNFMNSASLSAEVEAAGGLDVKNTPTSASGSKGSTNSSSSGASATASSSSASSSGTSSGGTATLGNYDMTSTGISVSPEALRMAAEDISKYDRQIQDDLEEINQLFSGLTDCWSSDASQYVREAFQKLMSEGMPLRAEVMSDVVEFLKNTVASNYEEAERTNTSLADSFL